MHIFIGIDNNGKYQYEEVERPNYGIDDVTSAVGEVAREHSTNLGMTEEAVWDMFIAAGIVTPSQRAADALYGQLLGYEMAECHEEVATREQWLALMGEMDALWRPESSKQGSLI